MTIVMNMSGYEIECESVAAEEYGDEVMYAELIPQLVSVGDRHITEMDKISSIPGDLANMDVDAFLRKMYRD
ncbi:MAG: hypothetical protein KKH12_01440 [Gammaproteobacteria bacterium]|nr:hypothetical protein [Gammaproteobacteria bacterium]MBU1480316.1 hypothetical protein [Gammaproteobacteria bacterium]